MSNLLPWFDDEVKKIKCPHILEIGTKRWGENPTHWKGRYAYGKYVMTDFMEGLDVDVVADAHELSKAFGEGSFDVVIARSVFEHLRKPWIVAEEMLKVLRPNGIFFVQTHQTFPIHAFPNDYYRYTREGLEVLFEKASQVISEYEFPARIVSEECGVQKNAFLNVCIGGIK